MNTISKSTYLSELKGAIELCERAILGMEMGFVKPEENHFLKNYPYVFLYFQNKFIILIICEGLRIQVTTNNIDKLPKFYNYLNDKLESYFKHDLIKKHSLTFFQGVT